MPRRPLPPALLVLTLTLAPAGLPAAARGQGLDEVKARYTKYEYQVKMRDGVHLFTSVYVPKDAGTGPTYPVLLLRTPYSVAPYGIDRYRSDLGPSAAFGRSGYIFAYQDVRGRWMSEGDFVNMRPEKDGVSAVDESTDTFDTIDWLVKNVPGNNGRVGQYGISYPGFYTACGLIDAHPALKAASPQAPVTDWFVGDDWHHNGAFFLTHCFNFMAAFGHPRPTPTAIANSGPFRHGTPDGYDFFLRMGALPRADSEHFKGDVAFWNEVMNHPDYDAWWKARNLRPHLKDVRPAVLTVGGWYDAENLFGALECYKRIEATSPTTTNLLVMGPWFHGGWSRGDGASLGAVPFNSKTSEFFRDQIEFPFFEKYLKGHAPEADLPEAYVFETGRNQWRRHESWPPKAAKPRPVYLRDAGNLAFEPPADAPADAADEYVSDPAHPVPFVSDIVNTMVREYMVADQRFASRRPDVLTYALPVLEKDLTVAGGVKVVLHVSTTGTDSDWVVKLVDVHPDGEASSDAAPGAGASLAGYQQLVRGDVFRGRYRKGFDHPEAFTPGTPTEVTFTLPDLYHTFRPGHRLMVQVQSSWFPLVDRNPQTFVDIYKAKPSDFHKATQRVYRGKDRASRLELPVLP